MPRRPIRKSRRRFTAKKGTRAIAKRAERSVKELARTREIKFHTLASSDQFNPVGAVYHLTNIAQGDGGTTRDGNQLTLRSLRVLGTFYSGTATASFPVRLIIFQDHQQVGDTTPAVTDVLLTANVLSMYNYPNAYKRFKILYDYTTTLTPAGEASGTNIVPRYTTIKRWIFPTAKNVRYNGSNDTDIQKNGLYMILIGTSNLNSMIINTQISFTDS